MNLGLVAHLLEAARCCELIVADMVFPCVKRNKKWLFGSLITDDQCWYVVHLSLTMMIPCQDKQMSKRKWSWVTAATPPLYFTDHHLEVFLEWKFTDLFMWLFIRDGAWSDGWNYIHPRKINMEPNNGGLVRVTFPFAVGDGCRFQSLSFSRVFRSKTWSTVE